MKKAVLFVLTVLLLFTLLACAEDKQEKPGDYDYLLLDDGTAEITQYGGNATQLEIPSQLDGYAVTGIGDFAFYGCESLTQITIPDGVTGIGNGAFNFCDQVTVTVNPGSYAEQYCQENGIACIYPDSES